MKVNMMGKDIEVSREIMLADGYCLSTARHAERLASGPTVYKVEEGVDSEGVRWLRGHTRYCRQCYNANKYKALMVEFLQGHHPSKLADWYRGKHDPRVIEHFMRLMKKKEPRFLREMFDSAQYNLAPANIQAANDWQVLMRALTAQSHPAMHLAQRAKIVRIDTDIVFRAWQLLGSAPEYDRKQLTEDWNEGRIRLQFPSVYFSFSEGINDHLIEQFFDNMPHDLLGLMNIHGFLASRIELADAKPKTFIMERGSTVEEQIAPEAQKDAQGKAAERPFLWTALLRALQDGVLTLDVEKTGEQIAEESMAEAKDRGVRLTGSFQAPDDFYAVHVNPNRTFRDPVTKYGKRHINWTHRWAVAGHWRQYRDGKRVWISGYVKGPEDKPFVPSVHVYGARSWRARGQNMVAGFLRRIVRWIRSLRPGGGS